MSHYYSFPADMIRYKESFNVVSLMACMTICSNSNYCSAVDFAPGPNTCRLIKNYKIHLPQDDGDGTFIYVQNMCRVKGVILDKPKLLMGPFEFKNHATCAKKCF
ncbi:unnamed protein product [Lepeophtheirus salmonis]|uniref:(salmon louse) hypothetical protein n=1 Tax=Lepeophtheirus salmonis TaxID=72036 RepID=A0A7R8CV41_LEPSM|nr:unnamed protein product [Lepeophtheirus salmonis]CAF2941932.1 unnamed protein product [Lepeophtheirus salmonis]